MMKIAAGIIFYNDRDSLRRCISSLYTFVDIIFCIDGKFPTFPGAGLLSSDGSRELIKKFGNKCILVDCPKPEYDKRQKYLELCREHGIDVLLIIDSDEYIIVEDEFHDVSWGVFRESLYRKIIQRDKETHNVYSVMFQHNPTTLMPYPRVWYKPGEMEYYDGRHYFFRNRLGNRIALQHQANHQPNLIEGITIGHDNLLRSKDHLSSRFTYQVWLTEYEKSL